MAESQKSTPFSACYGPLGPKLVDFHGWQLPVHFGSLVQEHHAVRKAVGVFDVFPNSWKSRSTSSSGIPGPVSLTSRQIEPGIFLIHTDTFPPEGVNFIAFPIILSTTRRIC